MKRAATVTGRGAERLRAGHVWIYRSDVAGVSAEPGDVVSVVAPNGRRLGLAFWSDRSEIALRLVTRDDGPFDAEAVRRRVDAALDFRERLAIDADAHRLIHAEGDLLPSIVADRYGDVVVVQALSQGADRVLPAVVERLVERLEPRGVLARHDARARALEGLPSEVRVLHGEVPPTTWVRDGAVEVEVDLWKGQKTGLFLDQRENRAAAAAYAHGRLLDAFSHEGGFALALGPRCSEVVALDVSAEAVARTERNAERNGRAVRTVVANAFDFLRAAERGGERWDTIVLDPPAFAKSRATVERALGGYKEVNLRALRMLAPGGILVTCSCSYHVSEALLADVVRDAAADARVAVSILESRMQSRDHPVLVGVPETRYLKCLILRRLDA